MSLLTLYFIIELINSKDESKLQLNFMGLRVRVWVNDTLNAV